MASDPASRSTLPSDQRDVTSWQTELANRVSALAHRMGVSPHSVRAFRYVMNAASPQRSRRSFSGVESSDDLNEENPSEGDLHHSAWFASLTYLMLLIRDFVTFFIRGGLSTMTFFIDLILGFFIYVFNDALAIPGVWILAYATRTMAWVFHAIMWAVYIALEMIFYLPRPILLIYLVALVVTYLQMPEMFKWLLTHILWLAQGFLALLKRLVLEQHSHEETSVWKKEE